MEKRYERNVKALSVEESERLKGFKVCVIGCGGLGGHVIEQLGRLGVGNITAVDGDVFEESNLNRQLFSDETVLGKSKAEQAKIRMSSVNSGVCVAVVNEFLDESNCESILKGHDIVVDALDNKATRIIVERAAQKLLIPVVHGAIAGWFGQVCVIMPGRPLYGLIYPEARAKGPESELGNLPFTAAVAASIEAAEAVKVLLGKENTLAGKFLTFDLLNNDFEVFSFF